MKPEVGPGAEVVVRVAAPEDAVHAEEAARLIAKAAETHDIARRDPAMLRKKIETGRAAVALRGGELVGFGYFSEWEGGKFVSHSGLVTREDVRGLGLGRKLKQCLFEASRRRFPNAATMSLTTSPQVLAMNRSLGFRPCTFAEMTKDPAFWEGCKACRNYEEIKRQGRVCCCDPMILEAQPGLGSGDEE